MPLRNDLLNPISTDHPTGKNLRFDPLYDKIKEARREDKPDSQGEWQIERKYADWTVTVKLITEALATKTKDLQLAVWLAQAMLRREGIQGFRETLGFIHKLLETYWEGIYPEIEDGDLELRSAPLEWLGSDSDRDWPVRPTTGLKFVPLTNGGLTFAQFMETREVGTEEAADSWDKQNARNAKIAEGKIPTEVFDKDFDATPKVFYAELEKTFDGTLEVLGQIEQLCDEKFGDNTPSFGPLKNVLTEVRQAVHTLLVRKRQKEPDAVEEAAPEEEAQAGVDGKAVEVPTKIETQVGAERQASTGGQAKAYRTEGGVLPGSWDEAVARVVGAAKFMRQQDAYSPAPYLMLRGLRWGELRASGTRVDPGKLAAPPLEIRQSLKRASLDLKWAEVLETAETAMGMECGRGWLDLQRYVVRACQELGGYYEPVRRAVIGELATLLERYPELPELTMMDDLPTANAETLAWIKKQVLPKAGAVREESVAAGNGTASASRSFEMAMQAHQAGRPEVCAELLNREIAQEPSGRGRFQRKVQLARMCQAAGNEAMALTLVQEAVSEIEQKRLEEWETREFLTFALGLFYRCLGKSDGSAGERERVYAWICRMDPLEALRLEK